MFLILLMTIFDYCSVERSVLLYDYQQQNKTWLQVIYLGAPMSGCAQTVPIFGEKKIRKIRIRGAQTVRREFEGRELLTDRTKMFGVL